MFLLHSYWINWDGETHLGTTSFGRRCSDCRLPKHAHVKTPAQKTHKTLYDILNLYSVVNSLRVFPLSWSVLAAITKLHRLGSLKVKSESESRSVLSGYLWPPWIPYSPWNFPGQNTGVGSLFLQGNLPNPGIKARSPTLQVDSLPTEAWSVSAAITKYHRLGSLSNGNFFLQF